MKSQTEDKFRALYLKEHELDLEVKLKKMTLTFNTTWDGPLKDRGESKTNLHYMTKKRRGDDVLQSQVNPVTGATLQ